MHRYQHHIAGSVVQISLVKQIFLYKENTFEEFMKYEYVNM